MISDLPELISKNTKVARFTKMRYGPVYVLNVAAGNSSDTLAWDMFKIYASIDTHEYRRFASLKLMDFIEDIKCCLMYDFHDVVRYVEQNPLYVQTPPIPSHYTISRMRAIHLTCPNTLHSNGTVPKGISLSVPGIPCDHKNMTYIQPFYPTKVKDTKLVIGTKMAFGNVSAELIIEWMETYKYLGA